MNILPPKVLLHTPVANYFYSLIKKIRDLCNFLYHYLPFHTHPQFFPSTALYPITGNLYFSVILNLFVCWERREEEGTKKDKVVLGKTSMVFSLLWAVFSFLLMFVWLFIIKIISFLYSLVLHLIC